MNASRLLPTLTVASLLVTGWFAPPVQAQQNQPIYPAYDGFLKNPDGTYTLSFAYFSHNSDVVTVPPGTANAFAPGPGDRQQPTVFKPGHWRFQCVMVVGPEFDEYVVTQIKGHLDQSQSLARSEDQSGVEPRTRSLALQVLRTRTEALSTLKKTQPGSS